MMNARVILCALLALTLVACGGAKAKEDTKTAESAKATSGPPAGSQELMQGSWAGTLYIPSIDMTTKITATIEGTMLKIRDEYGGTEGANRNHNMILGTGPDGSSLTVDLVYDSDEPLSQLCAATVSQGALTLCCNLNTDDYTSSRPGDVQPCDGNGDTVISLIRQ